MNEFNTIIIKGQEYTFTDPTKIPVPSKEGTEGDLLKLGKDGVPVWETAVREDNLEVKQFIQIRNSNTGAVAIDITQIPNTSIVAASLIINKTEQFIPLHSYKGITEISKVRVDDKLILLATISSTIESWELLNIYLTQYIALESSDITVSTVEVGSDDDSSSSDSTSLPPVLDDGDVIYGTILKNKITHINALTESTVLNGLSSGSFIVKSAKVGDTYAFTNLDIGSWLVLLLPSKLSAELDYGGNNFDIFPVIEGLESSSLSANGDTSIVVEGVLYYIYGMINTVDAASYTVRIKELKNG